MKTFIILAVLVAVAVAANPDEVVESNFDNIGVGPYRFGFKTSDGTNVQAQGQLLNEGTDNEAEVVSGSYSYVGDDGKTYSVNYVADADGYRPTGDHIPRK